MEFDPDLSGLFDALIQLPSKQDQAEFLDRVCGDDLTLRQNIEELLLAHQQCEPFPIDDSAVFGSNTRKIDIRQLLGELLTDETIATAESKIEKAGDRIGPYHLTRKLGSGGFGIVYQATQQSPLEREVAIKLIKPGMDTAEVLGRFSIERQALANMDHPSIARIFDAGETESGRPYFVMEFVDGASITEHCEKHQLTIRERVELLIQVCRGVEHAHQKSVIHRDIKPGNILIASNDGKFVPKLIDFGVAKVLDDCSFQKPHQTGGYQKLGTPLYMSPEQAVGDHHHGTDCRTDIYSLGAVLFELTTGSTPWLKSHFRESTDFFSSLVSLEPDTASRRLNSATKLQLKQLAENRGCHTGNQLVRHVAGELDWIIGKALQPEPERRYPNANELARDLQRYLDGEVVEAARPSRAYKIRKFVSQNRGKLAVATLMAGLLLAFSIVSLWFGLKATQNEAIARKATKASIEAREQERSAKERAVLEAKKFQTLFRDVDQLIEAAAEIDNSKRRQRLDSMLQQILYDDKDFRVHPELRARYLYEWASAFKSANQFDAAHQLLEQCISVESNAKNPSNRLVLDARFESLHCAFLKMMTQLPAGTQLFPPHMKPKLDEGSKKLAELIAKESELPPNASQASRAWILLGLHYASSGLAAKAIEAQENAIKTAEQAPDPDWNEIINAYTGLGAVADNNKKIAIFDRNLRRFDEFRSRIDPSQVDHTHLNVLAARNKAYARAGRHHEIIDELQESAHLVEKLTKQPNNRKSFAHFLYYKELTEGLGWAGRKYDAIEACFDEIEAIEQVPTEFSIDSANHARGMAYGRLAGLLVGIGQAERADRLLGSVPDFPDGLVDSRNPQSLAAHWSCLSVNLALKRFEDATNDMKLLHDFYRETRGEENGLTLQLLETFAAIASAKGQHTEAAKLRRDVLSRVNPANQNQQFAIRRRLGEEYLKAKDSGKAIRTLKPCYDFYLFKSNGQRSTFSTRTLWKVARLLSEAYSDAGKPEQAINLISRTLDETKELFGCENEHSLEVRKLFAKILIQSGQLDRAGEMIREIDCIYDQMANEADENWPKGWQRFNVRNRWLDIRLDLAEAVKSLELKPKVENSYLAEIESSAIGILNQLKNAEFNDPLLKQDMIRRRLGQIVRFYELQQNNEQVALWNRRLESANAGFGSMPVTQQPK